MMKYLLVLIVVGVAYLLWRNARIAQRDADATRNPAQGAARKAAPQDMIRCPVCAVHLPRGDAIAGRDGTLYCSQEHRLTAGG